MLRAFQTGIRAGLLLALASVLVLTSTRGTALDAAPQQARSPVTNAELRRMAATVRSGLSFDDAHALGVALARRNMVVRSLNGRLMQEISERLGQHLAERQLAWQANRTAGIHPARLAEQLNVHLETASGPDYLRVRPEHLDRGRVETWLRLPELSPGERLVAPGVPDLPRTMSPFEAYVVADWAIASKILNPAFTRTDAEERRASFLPPPELPPGMHAVEINSRAEEFVRHLSRVALRKWGDVDSAMLAIVSVLEESWVD